ncbi:threonine synthase [Gracilinema caldarium]|uniref:threonine synthase n=1 Tax=Gracilinema caldarium TaxID=215591 RepID=UPI0026EC5D94|nr:threonine synthase [Gracilinema caldarium]
MDFSSTRSKEIKVSFREAVMHCLPPDSGLYVPASMVDLRPFFLYMDSETSYPELVATVAPVLLQGELNPISAARVAESAFSFEPELKLLDSNLSVLELHNGPTGVFKDFGIAFLAAVMEELLKPSGYAMTLTATTGHTGASVAHAFQGRAGITAVILYPQGHVRGLDPATFVNNGGNILPIQIEGTFDDCQRLIRDAFEDRPFADRYGLTSANTINVGRLLPQAFYFLYAFIKIKKELHGDLLFSVPSGNFGNLIAGLYAWKFGLPTNGFIAAMNANDTFGDFFRGQSFVPHTPIRTLSRSMDVGNPSNYERLAAFYNEAPAVMKHMVYSEKVNDEATLAAMERAWKRYGIHLDPHGAVGFAAAERLLSGDIEDGHVVVLSTGHPAKYSDLVKKVTGKEPVTSETLHNLQKETSPVAVIPARLDALESAIAGAL